MIRKSILLALICAFVATAVMAHTLPDGSARKYAVDYQSLPYKHGANTPAWMTTAISAALVSGWVANNNSRNPRFSYSASGNGTVSYSLMLNCAGITNWVGCFERLPGTTWNIWVRKSNVDGGPAWHKLCEVQDVTGCRMAKRILLHEATHVTLTNLHDGQGCTLTVMGNSPTGCTKPEAGYNVTTLLECDQAAFQIKYGLQAITGSYGACLDHLAGAVVGEGLELVETHSSSTTSACAGVPISVSGRLATETNAAYGYLTNVNVASRVVFIDRKLHSSPSWGANWSSVTTSSATTGNNWSRSFTESPITSTYYDYRLHFVGEVGSLASEYSSVITLLFLNPCPPPP